jgi:hypothetical protein
MDLVEAVFDSIKSHPLFVSVDRLIKELSIDWLIIVVAVVTLAFSWVKYRLLTIGSLPKVQTAL